MTLPLTLDQVEAQLQALAARVTKLEPPPPPPAFIEPAGFKTIHDFDAKSQGSWLVADGTTIRQTFTTDLDIGPVMAQKYGPVVVAPTSTYGPGHLYFRIPDAVRPIHSFYLRTKIKLSPNWKQPPNSGDQKLFQMFGMQGGYKFGAIIYGGDTKRALTAYENQIAQPGYNGVPLGQKTATATPVPPAPDDFTLGTAHDVEWLVIGNTPGVANGKVIVVLDGKTQIDVENMMWFGPSDTPAWAQFDINALWGGQGGTLTEPQYMLVGPIHLSGA